MFCRAFSQSAHRFRIHRQHSWPKHDPYSILGVKPSASADDVRKAYFRLAKQLHPDRNIGKVNVKERFQELQEAFQLLNSPLRRMELNRGLKQYRTYDQFLRAIGQSGSTANSTSSTSTPSSSSTRRSSFRGTASQSGFKSPFKYQQNPFDYAAGPIPGNAADDDPSKRFKVTSRMLLISAVVFCIFEFGLVLPWMMERRREILKQKQEETLFTEQELEDMRRKFHEKHDPHHQHYPREETENGVPAVEIMSLEENVFRDEAQTLSFSDDHDDEK